MKVFALISGGKDSIFNIQKCIEHGHEITALGNLFNQNEGQEGKQLDSYMYQTVGTNITLAIAECLQKPIYRRKITGKPKIINLQYKQQHQAQKQGDQVEDLFEMIKEVKEKHPQINAVSTGAIFSTYQKLRVQNMQQKFITIFRCDRLGMTSLAYLWQRQQTQLLKQMIQFPLNAIIIKIASYGLKIQHLGKSIGEIYPVFMKLKQECGMNVCGQGGQFQSLVLDCPLFLKKIVIDQTQIIEVEKNEIAPVGYLMIKKYHLEEK